MSTSSEVPPSLMRSVVVPPVPTPVGLTMARRHHPLPTSSEMSPPLMARVRVLVDAVVTVVWPAVVENVSDAVPLSVQPLAIMSSVGRYTRMGASDVCVAVTSARPPRVTSYNSRRLPVVASPRPNMRDCPRVVIAERGKISSVVLWLHATCSTHVAPKSSEYQPRVMELDAAPHTHTRPACSRSRHMPEPASVRTTSPR
jgi:hypothetical protein